MSIKCQNVEEVQGDVYGCLVLFVQQFKNPQNSIYMIFSDKKKAANVPSDLSLIVKYNKQQKKKINFQNNLSITS